jgi:thiamine biosynthesis lipoprotein
MGMPISLALRGRHADDEQAEEAWDAVLGTLRDADRVFSTYREDSWISRLSRGEVSLEDCPAEVAEVLEVGEVARVESGGAFDVHRVDLDGHRVLDPSGIVKGWAVQRAARHLLPLEGTDFCLAAGGDMVCSVVDPAAPAWQVGIEDPRDPARLVARVPIRAGGIATSALTHRGAHIVDARTGVTPDGIASVTVVAEDLTWADIDATAAFAMGRGALDWRRGRPGRSGVVVWADGTPEVFAPVGLRAAARS